MVAVYQNLSRVGQSSPVLEGYHNPYAQPNQRFQSRTPCHAKLLFILDLSLLVAEDVGVTSVEDGHGRAVEELSASNTQLNLSNGDMVSTRTYTLQSLQKTSSLGEPMTETSGPKRAAVTVCVDCHAGGLGVRSWETYVGAGVVVNGGLGHHRVAGPMSVSCSLGFLHLTTETYYSSSLLRRGGVLALMIISLALPVRRALRVLR